MKLRRYMAAVRIEVKHLKKYYSVPRHFMSGWKGIIRAVDNISFKINPGETIGLVGESGCGKTTAARMAALLEKPTAGEIIFNGENADRLKGKWLAGFREKVQFVFPESGSSLHPQKNVYRIVSGGIRNFHQLKGKELIEQKVVEILNRVGLSGDFLRCFPHELPDCRKQRVVIARALAVNPGLLICDDPAASLDPFDAAQIISLLSGLKQGLQLSMLFISGDLGQARLVSDHILIMYRGKIVESAPVKSLFENTAHPYTKALISASTDPVSRSGMTRIILKEGIKSVLNSPDSDDAPAESGCCFADRCYMVQEICKYEPPLARQLIQGHTAYCHFAERV